MQRTTENENKSTASQLAVVIEQIKRIREDIAQNNQASVDRHHDLEQKLDANYVTAKEFASWTDRILKLEDTSLWIARIVGTAIIGAILALVLIK